MNTQIIYNNPNKIYYIYDGIYKNNKLCTKLITDGNTFKRDYTDDVIKYFIDSPDEKSIRLDDGIIYEVIVTDANYVIIQAFINDKLIGCKTYKENKSLLKRKKQPFLITFY